MLASLAALYQGATVVASDPRALVVADDPIQRLVMPGPRQDALYVIGAQGFYRSSDGGATWRVLGPPPPAPRIAVAADDSLLLAGSRAACGRAAGKNSPLYRSRDDGATWQPVAGIGDLLPLAIWGEPGLALGATCSGLQVSTDGGLTWRLVPAIPADYLVTGFAPTSDQQDVPTFFVVATSEGGTSILSLITLTARGEVASTAQLRTFWGGGAVGGSRERPVVGTAMGVLVGLDEGTSWRQSRRGLQEVTISVDPTAGPIPENELRRGFGILAIAIDAHDENHLYAGTIAGVYHSCDVGETWIPLPGSAGTVTSLIATSRGTLLAETDSGVVEFEGASAGAMCSPQATPVSFTAATPSVPVAPPDPP
jgi:photosystem II stability/assembly factor-like uncharacterized protein